MKAARAKALVGTTISFLLPLTACGKQDPSAPVPPLSDSEPMDLTEVYWDDDVAHLDGADPTDLVPTIYKLSSISVTLEDTSKGMALVARSELMQPGQLDDDNDQLKSSLNWGDVAPDFQDQLKIYVPQELEVVNEQLVLHDSRQVQFQFWGNFRDSEPLRRVSAGDEETLAALRSSGVTLFHDYFSATYDSSSCSDCYLNDPSFAANSPMDEEWGKVIDGRRLNAASDSIIVFLVAKQGSRSITYNVIYKR